MQKIRKGDTVVVTTGRDKGRTGTVVNILASGRVLVENVNMVKKHQRPNPAKGVTGAIVQKEAPLHLSNVALWNPATKKADRVGRKLLENGRKVRYFKSNGEVVDS
ncbi:MAG: rplX2 [Steroidobacteraceae bacterium]|jgi:large subunit ribosomal protein L24|nr:rplX2 [Steroidobacteraceae bacterium]MBM2854220.1 rplX2 [Steroidobacteraceae bacterium]